MSALGQLKNRLRPRSRLKEASTGIAIRLGLLRRLRPLRRDFGIGRGTPIDRHYIEDFLDRHQADIGGVVLEAGGYVNYTRRFGGDRVTRGEVLYPKPGFADGTLVGDLTTGEGIPENAFDCLLLTQVFPFIYDLREAVATCHRALRPSGVLLVTVPGISQICGYDREHWGDYWRFTRQSLERLLGDGFGAENVSVEAHGNVFASCAFLHGLSAEDLTPAELNYRDDTFQLTIMGRAVKSVPMAHARDPGNEEPRP